MAKKIRFALKMDDETEIRTLSELYDNFSLTRILEYISNGKLITWLRDRHYNIIADNIEKLDINNNNELPKQICEIFEIHNVAFNQDELYDLLDEQYNTIYLYGDKFEIPLDKGNITYIGLNNPIVVIISLKEKFNLEEKNIKLLKVQIDDKNKNLSKYRKSTASVINDTTTDDQSQTDNHASAEPSVESIVNATLNILNNTDKTDQPLHDEVEAIINDYCKHNKVDTNSINLIFRSEGEEDIIITNEDIYSCAQDPEALLTVLSHPKVIELLSDRKTIDKLYNIAFG